MARAHKEVEEAEELKKRLVPWYAAKRTTVGEATNRWQAPHDAPEHPDKRF